MPAGTMIAAIGSCRRERTAAGAILAAATLLAAWIVFHRSPQSPVRIVEQQVRVPEKPEPEQAPTPAQPPAMTFEIVELPAPAAPPPVAPAPVQTARAEPPQTPAPPPPVPEKPITPPEPPRAAKPMVVPLQPDAKAAAPIVPLQMEPLPERPTPEAKPLQLLRPGDEAPPPKPAPVQALQPEPDRPVSRETKSTLKQEPPPPAPAPVAEPAPKAAPKPEPLKTTSPPAPMIHVEAAPLAPVAEKDVATEGRALLRMFEQGAGPSIEIRWPSQAGERDRLYDVFTQCLGMKVGLLDDQGHVYLSEGPRTQAMALNMDKYSGFVRRPEGAIAADEQQEIARIRAYHGLSAPSARMFPRRVDAYLLGGLRAAVGDQYLKMKSVRAAYRLNGRRVMIDSIIADGHAVNGVIDLSTVAACN